MTSPKRFQKRIPLILFAAAICIVLAASAPAFPSTNETWLGGSGNWTNSVLWNPYIGSTLYPYNGVNDCTYSVIINSGGSVIMNCDVFIDNLTIGSGGSLTVGNGKTFRMDIETLGNGTITNNGAITLNSIGDATYFATTGGVIAGSGVLTMSDNENNHILTNSNNANLTNGSSHTIRGSGSIGSGSNATTLYNSGTIIANQSTPLIVYAGVTNTGAMEADGGELDFSYATVTNTNGTIEGANDSVVSLNGSTVTGGVLAGSVKTASGSYSTLSGVAITGDFTGANGSTTTLNGTITNSGTISIASTGDATYFATTGGAIAGSGVLTMSNNENNHILTNANYASLTNDASHTIQGSGSIGSGANDTTFTNSGTVIANQNAPLIIYAGVTNTGAMEADGGELDFSGATVTNTNGTIEGANDSVVSLNGSTVTGGVLAGNVKTTASSTATLANLTISGSYIAANGSSTTLSGTIINNGAISIASSGSGTYFATTGGALSGTGVITMSDNENNHILTNANYASLTNNAGHTIQGSGSIGNGGNDTTLTNVGTIIANQSTPLYFYGTVTNSGILEVKDGSEMSLAGGSLSNLSGSTLTGGVYTIAGILRLPGYVTTNAATITLDGTNAHIYYGSSGTVNALVNLSANASAGSISLTNGASATTSGSISNSGAITVGDSSTLTIGSSGSGTLTNSSAGSISGGGSIVGAVANSGTTTLGASTGPLSVTGTYTLSSASNLAVELSSETEGDSYCFLTVTGAANLGGTLTVALSGSYSPAIGSAFHIVKATGGFSSTKFATLNLPTLTAKAWLIEYGSTEVILKVVPPSLAPINSLLLSD